MKELKIANNLHLPLDAATQTLAFIGRKGSGKTYGAGKLAELLIDHGIQVGILDTVGNWYGLRLSSDGRSQGIDIPILGGLRGDIPLEPTGGALVADALVDSGRSMIIDASQFSKADRQRFAAAFGERLWKRKKAESNPSPIHLILEESQLIVPEMVRGDTAVMVGVYEEIIRLGRNYGIGISMLTQRPQSVSKEVLNQTECLMVFQVNGAHERKALKEWIVYQGMDVKLLDELPSLKPGDCYVWSPQWLSILQRIHIAEKRTFDSTRTPKVGTKETRGRDIKPIDLEDLKTKMVATIERAKAEDPRELRRQIAELKKELASGILTSKEAAKQEVKRVEIPVLKDRQIDRLEKLTGHIEAMGQALVNCIRKEFIPAFQQAKAPIRRPAEFPRTSAPTPVKRSQPLLKNPITSDPRPMKRSPILRVPLGSIDSKLPGPQQRILDALAWLESIGISPAENPAVAFLAGYATGGGAYNNPKGNLHSQGMIEYHQGGCLALTEAGRAMANLPTSPLSALELQARVLERLPGPERKILQVLIDVYPKDISNEELAERSGYAQGGGAFNNPKGRLRSLGLIDYPAPGCVVALPVLFLERG